VVLEPVAALPKLEIAESAGEVAPDELKAAVDAYNAGDFATAAELFRKLSIEAHDDERAKTKMRTNLARSLASMALAHYNNGDFNKSKSLYEEAIGYFREPDFIKGLAAAQIKLDDREGAVKSLESIEPDAFVKTALFDLYSMLGVKAKADGRVDEAVRNLEKALEIKPQSAELRTALSALKRETHAESGFRSKEGGHFVVKYDAVENAVAGHVISILLEEAYMRVGADLGFYPDDAITAVLYGAEQFRDVTRSPAWAGALYDGRIKVPAGGITEKTDLLEKVLIHEYTHAVVHRAALGRAPVWLNEGIAQYEEGKRTVSDAAALRGLASGNVTLRQLEGSFMRLGAREAEAAYLLSLSAVEYLMDEFGGSSVKRIMDGLKAGKNLDDAIHDATYLSYGDFNEAWLNSIKR
jgi:tetratricopeptide (TPR) repeat protein